MGTNYYWHNSPSDTPKHIGKSSCGWYFALRIYPEDGIVNLGLWMNLFTKPNTHIEDEYGRFVTVDEMLKTILERKGGSYLKWDKKKFDENYAERGEHDLVRSVLSDRCAGHAPNGEPYSYFIGEFS